MFPLKPSYTVTKVITLLDFMLCCYSYFIIAFNECYRQKIDTKTILVVIFLQIFLMYCQFITCRFKYGILVSDYLEIAKDYLIKGGFIIDMIIFGHYLNLLFSKKPDVSPE